MEERPPALPPGPAPLVCSCIASHASPPGAPEANYLSSLSSAVDNFLRHSDDQPTIGLILCKTKHRLVAEYTLQGQQKPIGVASYRTLPSHLRGTLPSPKELETGLVGLEVN
jgi:hypothetical protein